MSLDELLKILNEKMALVPPSSRDSRRAVFQYLSGDSKIRELIEWEIPSVSDLSDILESAPGRVLAVRLDRIAGGLGHKIPVVGGLLLRQFLLLRHNRSRVRGIMDGGNVSTGLALSYFAERFDLDAFLVLSRLFPRDIRRYIERNGSGRISTIAAPKRDMGREREFYVFLREISRRWWKERGVLALWHAKHGGQVLEPLGRDFASSLRFRPDWLVTCVGAGTGLEAWCAPIQDRFNGSPRIAIPEHEDCPLIRPRGGQEVALDSTRRLRKGRLGGFRKPPLGIPHMVMGPHYDELNPCLSTRILDRVDAVIRYSDLHWQEMSRTCQERGLLVGNSSAVNLLVSSFLAKTGATVLTFLYEPLREYYLVES